MRNDKRFECSYCRKRFVHLGIWFFRHVQKYHEKDFPSVKLLHDNGLVGGIEW